MSLSRQLLSRVLRAGRAGGDAHEPLDEALLFSCHERASKAAQASMSTCQAAGATAAQQRSSLDAAADHARLLFSRGRDIKAAAQQLREALERGKLIALNAGLEGSRMGEATGRPLVAVAEELKTLLSRGLTALEEHLKVLDEVERERERLREHVEQARQIAVQLADELLRAQAAQREAGVALADFAEHLQRSTGTEPETARAVSEALEHARGLVTVVMRLSSRAQRALLLRALGPSLKPLLRLLRELEDSGPDDEAE